MTTFLIFCTIPMIAVIVGMIYARKESHTANVIVLPEGNSDALPNGAAQGNVPKEVLVVDRGQP